MKKLKMSEIKDQIEFIVDPSTIEGFCDKMCFNFMGDMVDYTRALLENARAHNYEEKYGTDALKDLLRHGLAMRVRDLGEYYLQCHLNKEEMNDILGQDLDLEPA